MRVQPVDGSAVVVEPDGIDVDIELDQLPDYVIRCSERFQGGELRLYSKRALRSEYAPGNEPPPLASIGVGARGFATRA